MIVLIEVDDEVIANKVREICTDYFGPHRIYEDEFEYEQPIVEFGIDGGAA